MDKQMDTSWGGLVNECTKGHVGVCMCIQANGCFK